MGALCFNIQFSLHYDLSCRSDGEREGDRKSERERERERERDKGGEIWMNKIRLSQRAKEGCVCEISYLH